MDQNTNDTLRDVHENKQSMKAVHHVVIILNNFQYFIVFIFDNLGVLGDFLFLPYHSKIAQCGYITVIV